MRTSRRARPPVVRHFSTTVRQHHDDEERHIFPKLASSAQPEIVQTILRLQQDHDWLEEGLDGDFAARGRDRLRLFWYDLDVLVKALRSSRPCRAITSASRSRVCIPRSGRGCGAGERREMGREMAARAASRPRGARTSGGI
jgi:hypothetical protein